MGGILPWGCTGVKGVGRPTSSVYISVLVSALESMDFNLSISILEGTSYFNGIGIGALNYVTSGRNIIRYLDDMLY